jgi:adenine C2-methylase RlmN of 23S rRNA A2503 and tRNA A37
LWSLTLSLQVSLRGPTDEIRARLMPAKARISIAELLAPARLYAEVRNDVVDIDSSHYNLSPAVM